MNHNLQKNIILKNSFWSLKYASDELQNNYNIVFEAIKNNGLSLQYVSKELKNNYVILISRLILPYT